MREILLAALATLTISGSASAMEWESLLFLQMRLNDLGHEAGDPDGVMGPRTRSAIEAYAQDRNIQPTAERVFQDMLQRSRQARKSEELSDEQRRELESVVAENLLDPQSALFHEELYRVDRQSGAGAGAVDTICGRVNARNSFGGYVGYRYFQVRILGWDEVEVLSFAHMDNEPLGVSWYFCNMMF